MSSHDYQRILSGVERYSLVINEVYRYNVDGIVSGYGSLSADELQRAVAVAAAANPGLRVRLKSVLYFSKWVDSGIAPKVVEINAPRWDGCSELNADFLLQRFTPFDGGPIADVMLVRGADKKIFIIFRSLHAAMDGRSVMHWMQEVFRALRGEVLIGGASTLTDYDVAAQYRDHFTLDKKPPAMPVYIPIVPPSDQRDPELHYMWRTISIPGKINNILPRAAVYLAEYAHRQGEGVVGFTIPVDLRGRRTDVNSNGNLTGYLRIHVNPDDTPKTIMRQINQQIHDYVDCKVPLGARVLRWIPVNLLIRKLRKTLDAVLYTVNKDLPTGGLVSMGQTDQKLYSTEHFRCDRMYGIPGAVGKLNMVAINLPDVTIVTFSAPKNYNRNGEIDRLTQDFAQTFSARTNQHELAKVAP
ncbi:MAG TPA: hypothetical protein VGK97_02565 [Spongiibacteraceae bacterium]|jgi:hypothetical protein